MSTDKLKGLFAEAVLVLEGEGGELEHSGTTAMIIVNLVVLPAGQF